MTERVKLPAIKGGPRGCLNCGYTHSILPLKTRLYNSFGGYHITKNGKLFFMEDTQKEYDECKTLQYIENRARKSPGSDWRCIVSLPLRGAEYQRQGKNKWVLIREDRGFA